MRTLIAIPVYNEEAHVQRVLARVRQYVPRCAQEILVIDDGSTDGTAALLARERGVRVFRHEGNLGYGRSLIDAFRWAQREGFDWVVTMDCDEQHEPDRLPDFARAIAQDDADIVSGSRYLDQQLQRSAPPADRRAINAQLTRLINQTLGLELTDAFCGYKAHRVEAMARLSLDEPGYAFPMQLWAQAWAFNLRVREIPVSLIYNDPNRSFGGPLDDPKARLAHYLDVFRRELARFGGPARSMPVRGSCPLECCR